MMVGVGIRGTDYEGLYNEIDRRKNRFPKKGSDSEGDGLTGLHCNTYLKVTDLAI